MDTKLKKWKNVVSFTAFAVGVSMVLGSAAGFLSEVLSYGNYGRGFVRDLKESMDNDYQHTDEFQQYMEERLEMFITMAAGNMPASYNGYWSSNNYYGMSYAMDGIYNLLEDVDMSEYEKGYSEYKKNYEKKLEQYERSVTQAEAGTGYEGGWEVAQDDYSYNWYDYDGGYDYEEWLEKNITPEKRKEITQAYHNKIKEDKNLLYSIMEGDKVLYTNSEEVKATGDFMAAPEGYNFLMYFDGQKVRVQKDGKEMDVYGDSYYREEDYDWYVPGYKNFVADESMKDIRICMAAAKEPLLYTLSGTKEAGYQRIGNRLYWIQYNMKEMRDYFVRRLVYLAAGLALIAVYLFLRRYKKEADRDIARFTGKIWFEPKLLVLLGAIGIVFYGTLYQIISNYGMEWNYAYSYNYYPEFMAEVTREFVYNIRPSGIVLLFWCFYLVINDMSKNRQSWKHGLTYKICRIFSTKNMKQPLAKRLMHRSALVFAIAFIYGAASWIMITAAVGSGFGSSQPWLFILLFLAGLVGMAAAQYFYSKRLRVAAEDMELLSNRISDIRDGDYESSGERPKESDLSSTIDELEDIRMGMEAAVDEQMKSERMKVELIANVSHDIKTPLTSIISYVEFLKQEENLPDHVKDYIHILDEKSQRLKNMVQDVFAVSKAASGELPVNMEVLDFAKLLRQTMADMDEQIRDSSVTFRAEIPDEAVLINADGQRLYRVFQNLFQNAIKYSLDGSRVYITLKTDGTMAVASVKNTSKTEIDQTMDYAERFTRGDGSRTDGGSGLGLSIAQSFTEACGGSFRLESIADLFVVTVEFRIVDK